MKILCIFVFACSGLYVCFQANGSLSALENEMHYPQSSIAEIASRQLQTFSPSELDKDWQLNAFFGHIKIIGSKDSPRYPQLLKSMKEIGLTEENFELSPAVVPESIDKTLWSRVFSWSNKNVKILQGLAACTMAHYHLIKDTKKRYDRALQNYACLKNQIPSCSDVDLEAARKEVDKYSSVLIMEDNNAFGLLIDGIPTLKGMGTKFRETIAQLPDDWDMFYFLCMHAVPELPRPQPVSERPLLLKATYGLVNKCFAVRSTIYDKLVKQYESFIYPESQLLPPSTLLLPADHIVARLHDKVNAYIAKEPIAFRFASNSMLDGPSIEAGHQQYWPEYWPE